MRRSTAPSANWRRWRAANPDRRLGRAAAVTGVAVLLLFTPAAAQPADGERTQIAALLVTRATAVERGDRSAFRGTMRGAPTRFIEGRLAWFDRLQTLPLSRYELELADDTYLDLAPALIQAPPGDEVRVVVVTQRLGFGRYDPELSAETLVLTVVRRGERWSIVDDAALEELGLFSARAVWDFADVGAVERGSVLALHHGRASTARDLASGVEAAISRIDQRWPIPWAGRTVVVLPRSASDLAEIFHTTVDLTPFVAFAASSSERTADGVRSGGVRIYIQPDTYFAQPTSFREEVLGHELVHAAAAYIRGAATPSWLEEAVAQVYGERGSGATPRLDARVRAGTFVGRLPEDHEYFLGDRDAIRLSYESARSFAAYLQDRFDRDAPARLYQELGRISPVSFGTARYHLDRAARRAMGIGFDRLERAWLRSIGAVVD